jgi:hypothetical protein
MCFPYYHPQEIVLCFVKKNHTFHCLKNSEQHEILSVLQVICLHFMNRCAVELKVFYIYWNTFYNFVNIGEWKPKRTRNWSFCNGVWQSIVPKYEGVVALVTVWLWGGGVGGMFHYTLHIAVHIRVCDLDFPLS